MISLGTRRISRYTVWVHIAAQDERVRERRREEGEKGGGGGGGRG